MWDETQYMCSICGSWNYIRVDPSAGFEQEFIEECQTCCQSNRVHITIDPDSLEVSVRAEMEEE